MGISGHILGARNLRRLNAELGTDFDRAYRLHHQGGGRRVNEQGQCEHYDFNLVTKEVTRDINPMHWTSCYDQGLVHGSQRVP